MCHKRNYRKKHGIPKKLYRNESNKYINYHKLQTITHENTKCLRCRLYNLYWWIDIL